MSQVTDQKVPSGLALLKARMDDDLEAAFIQKHPKGMKKCNECRQMLSRDMFGILRVSSDGSTGKCKNCSKEKLKKLRNGLKSRSKEEILYDRQRLRPNGKKKCTECQKTFSVADFRLCKLFADGLTQDCKNCHDLKGRIVRAKAKAVCDEVRGRGCARCGFKNINCIELAHIDQKTKLVGRDGLRISPSKIRSIPILMKELELVEPLCGNCHAKETYKNEEWANMASGMKERRELINSEKTKRGCCIDCKMKVGDLFSIFEFDHVRDTKTANISEMRVRYWDFTDAQVQEELEKCQLRCRNCHRIVTAQRREETKKSK